MSNIKDLMLQQEQLIEDGSYETPYYRYIELDENKVIMGILLSTDYEPDRTDLMYVADDNPDLIHINYGWRLGDDGSWYPPGPPTEEENLTQEFHELNAQLGMLYQHEQYANWLGVDPDTPIGRALLPEPVYEPPEPPGQDPSLLVAFARLGGILTPELEAELSPIMPMRASIEERRPCPVKSKRELLSRIGEVSERLECLKGQVIT